jgi:hypothetical protein
MSFNGFSSVLASVSTHVLSVSIACFKCFICLYTYVANVSSGCFKNRSDVILGDQLAIVGAKRGK